jgi:hypothetical protein
MTAPAQEEGTAMLVFAHLGDLHIVDPRRQNAVDLLAIVAQIEMECVGNLDFVVLPGDNADNGLPSQYALVATALKMLSVPVHVIPGDHDMEGGSLDAFHASLAPDPLPKAVSVGGVHCLFLDISGRGSGGPDFRLEAKQLRWFETELRHARERREPIAVFMHSYPADLKAKGETEAVNRLIASNDVALVDIGHTHYNELANDGRTIFAATRSTGQIEEGPVGFALTTIDTGVVSWRFKLLDEPFPFIMITAPADYRLVRNPKQVATSSCEVRAVVFGARRLARVEVQVEDGERVGMRRSDADRHWRAEVRVPELAQFALTVRAVDETGRPGVHAIRPAGRGFRPREHRPVGSDAVSIGAWPGNHIFGTQLGPNRNGKPLVRKL